MLFPVRCFSCNRIIGDMYDKYSASSNKDSILDRYNICCKRMFLSHVDNADNILSYHIVKD